MTTTSPVESAVDNEVPLGATRVAERHRVTKESDVTIRLDLCGSDVDVATGLPFFDHMLQQLGRHGGFGLYVRTSGDLGVDAHHSVEDTGIALGECLVTALGDKAGVRRFASIAVPLDEALIEVALDLSGRPYLHYAVALPADAAPLGTPGFEPQLAEEFWRAFVTSAKVTLHLESRRGRNSHHLIEAAFKAAARALRDAVRVEGAAIPSTKGVL